MRSTRLLIQRECGAPSSGSRFSLWVFSKSLLGNTKMAWTHVTERSFKNHWFSLRGVLSPV